MFLAAAFGIGVFLVLAWGATTVSEAAPTDVDSRIRMVRAALGSRGSLLVRTDDDGVTRRDPPPRRVAGDITHLYLLSYRARERRLIEVDVPFWFFALKAPAAQFMIDGTGFDLRELGVTAEDLEAHGPGVILDESAASGDRLLIWTGDRSQASTAR